MHKQRLKVSQVVALLVKYFLLNRVCILNSSKNLKILSELSLKMWKLQRDQNSLIMLSLDLPTPTHFTGTCRKSSMNRM